MKWPVDLLLFSIWATCFVGSAGLEGASLTQETSKGSISALHQVVQMLADMSARGGKEKKDEEVAFAKFSTWCKTESENLKSDITKGAEELERLGAEIGQLASDVQVLGEAVMKLNDDETSDEADLKAKQAQRKKEQQAAEEQEKDFTESIDALERALITLASASHDRPAAAAALLQVSSLAQLPEQAQDLVNSFLDLSQDSGESAGGQAPEANAYEFQSGGLTTMLKRLRDDFRDKLGEHQKEDMNAAHAFGMIELDLRDSVANAKGESSKKKALQDRKKSKKAVNTKQLTVEKKVQAESEKQLAETHSVCTQKTQSFKEKQHLRTEELEAIAKASELLQSPDVAGAADKHLTLAQTQARRSLLQVGEEAHVTAQHRMSARGQLATSEDQLQSKLSKFLVAEGQRLNSKTLTLLAEKMTSNPFYKVKRLIGTLIDRLLEEANEDAKHQGFCDEEMGKSKVTRTKLTERIDELTASIADRESNVIRLGEDTAQLAKEVADLRGSLEEATVMRVDEKAKNKETVKDAASAAKGVAAAVAVLKDFYTKASVATGFLQSGASASTSHIRMGSDEWEALGNSDITFDKGHQEGKETFGEVERGQEDRFSSGVLGLLEVIAADFATLEVETTAGEHAAAKSYSDFMADSNKNLAVKSKKMEMNHADKVAAEAKIQEDTFDLKHTQDELLSAERYHDKLVPQCIDQGQTWEERVDARKAEVESLRQALGILDSDDVA